MSTDLAGEIGRAAAMEDVPEGDREERRWEEPQPVRETLVRLPRPIQRRHGDRGQGDPPPRRSAANDLRSRQTLATPIAFSRRHVRRASPPPLSQVAEFTQCSRL